MVDIQSANAEIRRRKKERKKKEKRNGTKNIMSASATQGGHKQSKLWGIRNSIGPVKVIFFSLVTVDRVISAEFRTGNKCLFMAAPWNRAGHYIFALWFLLLFFLA